MSHRNENGGSKCHKRCEKRNGNTSYPATARKTRNSARFSCLGKGKNGESPHISQALAVSHGHQSSLYPGFFLQTFEETSSNQSEFQFSISKQCTLHSRICKMIEVENTLLIFRRYSHPSSNFFSNFNFQASISRINANVVCENIAPTSERNSFPSVLYARLRPLLGSFGQSSELKGRREIAQDTQNN